MNILYGIQGTGHGHISRAKELLPELGKHANVDVLISGSDNQLSVSGGVTFHKHGISLTYDSNGGVSLLDTLRDLRPIRFISDVRSTSVRDYDLVISDYEPITAWSAKLERVASVGLSHQAAFLSPQTPRPERKSPVAEALLQHFAPVDYPIGVHFQRYDEFIEPPIIRPAIRKLEVTKSNHITVYLPAYHHDVLRQIFAPFTHIDWHIFSPSCDQLFVDENMRIHPISNKPFLDSLASCRGVICNAGFETCSEAMYLGKKLLPVPIQKQYEQECNIAALEQMGVFSLDSLQGNSDQIWKWLEDKNPVRINEIANPEQIVKKILSYAATSDEKYSRSSKSVFRLVG